MYMNLTGCLLLTIIAVMLYKIHTEDTAQTGAGELKQVTIANKYQEPYFSQHYRELDSVDNVLNRPLQQPDRSIKRVRGHFADTTNEYVLRKPPKYHFKFSETDVVTEDTPEDVKVMVEEHQPYFLDGARIIDKDGEKFYVDARYPEQPISVEFAVNPEKYVREHPSVYPSYVIASQNLCNLQPYDPMA